MPIVLSRKGGGGTGGTGTAQALSIGVSTGGNTAGNTTVNSGSRFVIVGSNGITASQATAAGATTVTLSGAGAADALSVGVSTGGNSSGDTTVNTGSRFVLAGGNNITLSQGTAAGATTVSISAPATSSLSGTGGVSISTDGNTIQIGVPALAGSVSMWPQPISSVAQALNGVGFTSAATRTTVSGIVWPMAVEQNVGMNHIRIPLGVSYTSATTNSHWNLTLGHSFGIYTLTGNSLSLVSSFSNYQLFSYSSAANSTDASATWSMSYGSGTALSGTTSISTNNAGNTSIWTRISTTKWHPLATGANSLSFGQYFGAWVYSSSSAGANLASMSHVVINNASSWPNDVGGPFVGARAAFPLAGMVSMTQTDTAMPISIATADVATSAGALGNVNRLMAVQMLSSF